MARSSNDALIVIDCEPVPKGRPRMNTITGRTYTPERTSNAENYTKIRLKQQYPHLDPWAGAVALDIVFVLPRPKKTAFDYPPKSDLDNYVKLFCDAANGILWNDDKQVVKLTACKLWGEKPATIAYAYPLSPSIRFHEVLKWQHRLTTEGRDEGIFFADAAAASSSASPDSHEES